MYDRETVIEIAAGAHDLAEQYIETLSDVDSPQYHLNLQMSRQMLSFRDWILKDIGGLRANPETIDELKQIIALWESELFLTRVE